MLRGSHVFITKILYGNSRSNTILFRPFAALLLLSIAVPPLLWLLATSSHAEDRTLTFSEFPVGKLIGCDYLTKASYEPLGVCFSAMGITEHASFPNSPVAQLATDYANYNTFGAVFADLIGKSRPIKSVSFDIGPFSAPNEMIVAWYREVPGYPPAQLGSRLNSKAGIERISIASTEPFFLIRLTPAKLLPPGYPRWNIDNFTFDAIGSSCATDPTQCPVPKILLSGVDVTDKKTTVAVGQRIALSAAFESGVVSAPKWVTPGNPIAAYTVSSTCPKKFSDESLPPAPCSASVVQLDGAAKGRTAVSFFWNAPGPRTVDFEYKTPSGVPGIVSTNFDVAGLRLKMPSTKYINIPVKNEYNLLPRASGSTFLQCGSPGKPCVEFERSPDILEPPGYRGSLFWVQTIESYTMEYQLSSGAVGTCVIRPGRFLDNSYPYGYRGLKESTSDSPGWPIENQYIRQEPAFHAKMYLMWQATGVVAYPVALGYVDWSWSGSARKSGSTWIRGPAKKAIATYHASGEYPVWSALRTLPPDCR